MNIASGVETKILDMAKQVNAMVGNKAGIIQAPKRVWDTKMRLLASIDQAKALLGYQPQTSFDVGLEKTINWFKANWDNVLRDAEFPPGMSSATMGFNVNLSKKL